MTATNHAITGAAAGLIFKQPVLAITAAFLSHFVIDALPHFKVKGAILERNRSKLFWTANFLDMVFTVILFVVLPIALRPWLPAWVTAACMAAGILPDVIWFWRVFGEVRTKIVKPKSRFSRFHNLIQWSESQPGIALEVVWFIGMWAVILARA